MRNWSGRRVFVTGATGLVGSWLVRSLVDIDAYVVTLVRDWDPQAELVRTGTINKTSVVSGCLEDYGTLERAINEHEIDTVIHLGAQAIVGTALRNPLPTFESNIRGTYNLLEACRIHCNLVKRVVVASSDKAYGDSEVLPYTEDMPPLGCHPYDVSKSCTDMLAHTYYNTYGLPVVVARCGNIYGGGDMNWSRIVPGTIKAIHAGNQPIIRSDGKFTRDYVYVMDAVNAYLTMAEALEKDGVVGEAFNFGPRQPHTVLEVVDVIRTIMGRDDLSPIVLDEAKAEIRDQYLSSEKAARLLNWNPEFTLEDGLRETVAWYLRFLGGTS